MGSRGGDGCRGTVGVGKVKIEVEVEKETMNLITISSILVRQMDWINVLGSIACFTNIRHL